MSIHSRPKQIALFTVLVTSLIATRAYSADPKIIKTSHAREVREEPVETADSKPDELSYSPQWPEPPNTGAILMRLGFGTIAVMGLCVASLWLGKPWLQRLHIKSAGNPNFFIEGSLTAGNRATLYLVRVGQTQLVAGIDASGLKSLIAIPPTFKEVLDEEIPDGEPTVAAPQRSEHPLDQISKANTKNEAARAALQRPFAGPDLFKSGLKD